MSGVQLIQGADEVLLAETVREAINEALGDASPDLSLANLEEPDYALDDGGWSLAPLVDAAQTAPFLTDSRVVVGRHLARFTTKDSVAALVRYLENPLDTTTLILVWSKGPKLQKTGNVPKSLSDALKASGASITKVAVGTGKAAKAFVDERVKASSLDVRPAARAAISDHLGEDANRLGSLLRLLESTWGPGATIDVAHLDGFLGDEGGVPPWELTDAIAKGNIPEALHKLTRMQNGGGRHPLALMATLQTHYARMMKLDGAEIGGEKAAAELLGMKGSTFPAKKALGQSRRMGTDRLREAVGLLAQADGDLRGKSAVDGAAQMEVLVARLTRLSR